MNDKLERFRKFIIRNIVDTVDYDVELDKYIINRVHISDELINNIVLEGTKYGLEKATVLNVLNNVANNISFAPSVESFGRVFGFGELNLGTHVILRLKHSTKGEQYIEAIKGTNSLILLESSYTGLCYGDLLFPLSKQLVPGFNADFTIVRGGSTVPKPNCIFNSGIFDKIEIYSPPIVNSILDAKSDFVYKTKENESKKQPSLCAKKIINFWTPSEYNDTISFSWKDEDCFNAPALFQIRFSTESNNAELSINSDIEWPQDKSRRESLIEILLKSCRLENLEPVTLFNQYKNIRMIENGVLQKIANKNNVKWILIKKPLVSITSDEKK